MKNKEFYSEDLVQNKSLAEFTWFNVGGSSKYYFQPKSAEFLITRNSADTFSPGGGEAARMVPQWDLMERHDLQTAKRLAMRRRCTL